MQIRISLTYTVDDADDLTTDQVQSAADALADIMHVQAEDGLYPLGWEDGYSMDDDEPNDRLSSLSWVSTSVEVEE